MKRVRRGERGFSLIEMMVVATVMSSVAAVLYSSFAVQSETMLRERGNTISQNRLRMVADRIVRETQSAGFDPLDTRAFGLLETSPTAIRFTVDANGDGVLQDTAAEKRGFDLDAGRLRTWLGGDPALDSSWRVLATNVLVLDLEYFDAEGNPTALEAAVRQMRLTIRAQSEGRSARVGPAILTHSGHVSLRNLR